MPLGLPGVLLSPWLGATSSIENSVRKWASHLPLVERVAVDYGEHTTLRLDSPRALRGVLKALDKAKADIDTICQTMKRAKARRVVSTSFTGLGIPLSIQSEVFGSRPNLRNGRRCVWSMRATQKLKPHRS